MVTDKDIALGTGAARIPERLLLAHARGEVLFLAGAGVSRFACLPSYAGLVKRVYERLDPSVHSVMISTSDNPDISGLTTQQQVEVLRFRKDEYDVVLGMLERRLEGQPDHTSLVRDAVRDILPSAKPAPIHRALLRLADRASALAIFTTNFDLLFETAARGMRLRTQSYSLGGIPRPTRNREFNGILHLHGALERHPTRTSNLVLSDQDFGEFYMRRRVVPDLIYDAARLYHLVLVGYGAKDPPMKYLLDSVAADVARFTDIRERFIFVGVESQDDIELHDWRARGITPIPYLVQGGEHSHLQDTIGRWARLSAINGDRRLLDREIGKLVRVKRHLATDEQCDLLEHFFRRSGKNERQRLSQVASSHSPDIGWIQAIQGVLAEATGEDHL